MQSRSKQTMRNCAWTSVMEKDGGPTLVEAIPTRRLPICTLLSFLVALVFSLNLPGQNATPQLTDFAPAVTGATLTVQPGNIRFGTMFCDNFKNPATASITAMNGGNGIGKLYVSSTCALVLQYPNSLKITWKLTGMSAQPVVTPTVPSDSWYVAEVKIGPSALTTFIDKRSIAGVDATKAGTGIVEDCTLGPCLISTDPAVIPTLGGVNAYTGTEDASAATITKPSRTVSSDPSGACPNNNEIILSTASGNLFSCLAAKWHATAGSSGNGGGNAPGVANLTTLCAVPYVSAGATLNQDPANFCWDSTNHRLGIGKTKPKSKLAVVGLAVFPNNAAAIAGGLTPGDFYRTGGDPDLVAVVH
jgi:hypothetical protein